MLIGLLLDLAFVVIFPVVLLGALLGTQRLERFVPRDVAGASQCEQDGLVAHGGHGRDRASSRASIPRTDAMGGESD